MSEVSYQPFTTLASTLPQDWLQLQAKSQEASVRREVNQNTVEVNRQMADERRLAELQEKVSCSRFGCVK